MSPELEKKLVEKYPGLFRDKDLPPTQSLMCFGCEHDDGWYDIVEAMCGLISRHLEGTTNEHPYRFTQIKEKFGGLRVYGTGGDDYIHGVVDMAESMSYKTCEVTGQPGRLHHRGIWLKTLSDAKASELDYERYDGNEMP